jgi:outer membrane protein assembly factor BamB
MFRGDLQQTGVFDAGGSQPAGELKWKFETDGQVWSSPAIADGFLYFGNVFY